MKRNMELVREILLKLEDKDREFDWSDYTSEQLRYHQALTIDAKLTHGSTTPDGTRDTEIPAHVHLKKLTWKGHDFIEAIADDGRWSKIKKFLKEAGKVITIETIKFAAKQLFGAD